MAESGESPRLSDELGPVDYLMHRGEANPRTRSGIMALELLDGTPDWDRFRTRFENASRRVLRLRQKVVVPTLPTAAPRWVVDPDFNLDFHVRRVRVSGPATLREVLDLAEVILQSPLDISRPLWTATLVEGMADGRAAMLLHVSHAVTDGVGGVEMFAQIYDLERDPPPRSTPPQPIPEDLSPNDLMRRGINHLPIAVVGGVLDALSGAVSMAGRAVLEPVSTVSGILGYARSGIRVLNRAAEPSPLLRRRSLTTRTEAIDIRLADLHKAAKAGGGSINDAYLAGLCGALRRYHEALGVPISTLPMAVPVNLRAEGDAAGGNQFTGEQPGGAGGHYRSGGSDEEDPGADDPASRRARDEHHRFHCTGAECLADGRAGGDHRFGDRFRCASQQCSGLPRGYLPCRREDTAAVRYWTVARCGDDGSANFPGRVVHRHGALRQGVGAKRRVVRSMPAGGFRRNPCAGRWSGTACAAGVVRYSRSRFSASIGVGLMSAADEQGEERATRKSAPDLRLPGSVAEILASPAGPKVGAFFDLDGTLVAGFTAVILTQERLRRRDMGVGELLGMVQAGLNHTLGRIEFEDLIGKAAAALAGRLLTDLEEIGERLFAQRIESRIYPEMRELVRAHVARGHTVVLSSSALTIQVGPVARFLGINNMLTNKFETNEDGILTGGVLKPILWCPGKATAVQRFAAEHDIDLKDSYFYADGDEDVALMYLVGNPRPTNPEGKMAAVAKRRGWPILKFNSRGGVGIRRQLRTLAGLSTIVPVAAGAVGIGVLTGSRRRGVNFFTSTFSQLLLATSGVHLNVIGKENLTAQRPAVFIFNHRNQVDPVIAGALVRDNWVGVGKKELASDPIMGTLGKLLDGVFIDRDDPVAAVETLHTVEERARNGLSIVIAPEGTRLDTTEVGSFKKGPFRIAMAAKIPIVPIVIRNAEIVASRNSTTINPGTVDVAVFPPIPVDDWTLDALPDRIAEVRQLYLDTLADWPVDGLPAVDLYAEQKAARKARAQVAKATAKRVPAKKAPAKSAANKGAAATKAATKKASPKAKPSESKIAGKDGEASASPSSSAKGRS